MIVAMTTIAGSLVESTETLEAMRAYLDGFALAEPIQARLWQESEITVTQAIVLRELRQGPQTSGRLGQEVGLSATSMTRLIDRLERRGLVSRRRESDDRRCVHIHLEPAGERLLSQMRILRGSDLHQAIEAMTGDERRALTLSLRRLVELTRSAPSREMV